MKKSFFIWFYLFIVILLSWPFQFWYVFKAETAFDKYLYSSLAKKYFKALHAFVKGFYAFTNSARCLYFEEPVLVNKIIEKDVLNGTNRLSDKMNDSETILQPSDESKII